MDTLKFLFFYESFDTIVKCIKKLEMSYMRKYSLRAVHLRCLLRMRESKRGMSVTELSRVCKTDKALISRTLRELTEEGFITSVGGEGEKTYNKKYCLTEKSEDVINDVSSDISRYIQKARKDISEEDVHIFYDVLASFEDNISRIDIK
ncbi:MAG: MarR family winged helix-turn-helix transcriptional regulator [Eubacteriales bacterium]